MITISLTTAVILYSVLILLGMATLWLFGELGSRRSLRVLEKQNLWRCTYCGYVYLDESAGLHSRCPRCNSINIIEEAQDRVVARQKERFVEAHPLPVEPDNPDDEPRRNPSHRKRPRAGSRGPRRHR